MPCPSTGWWVGPRDGWPSCSSTGTGPASSSWPANRRPRPSPSGSRPPGSCLADGARGEVCLEIDGWASEVSSGLARGAVLVIDYGHPAADLYGPTRAAGTLLAYSGHRVHDDWAIAVGRQDLTAQVDFSALDRAARATGLSSLGQTSQAEFLVGAGMNDLLEAIRSDPTTTMEDWLAVRSSVARLLDPRAMGGFRVGLYGRGLVGEPALAGLSFHLRS